MKVKYIILLLLFSIGKNTSVFSQELLLDEIPLEKLELKIVPLKAKLPDFPKKLRLKKDLEDASIKNASVRYSVQHLKRSKPEDNELKHALDVLLHYVEDDSLKQVIEYLKSNIQTGSKERESALSKLKNKVLQDSINIAGSLEEGLYAFELKSEQDLAMENLLSYIERDSNYTLLQKIGRDSVQLSIFNGKKKQMSFWINNNLEHYYRFWPKNSSNTDSIGAWLHVIPGGNFLGILVDDDVYQTTDVLSKPISDVTLKNDLSKEYFNIKNIPPGKLLMRHWRYYTSLDLLLGQGMQTNWAAGGENSLSLLANFRTVVNYNKDKVSWENYLYYKLGFLKSGSEDIRKNEDLMEINSKIGYKAFRHWFYTGQLNVQTQLFNSYEYQDKEKNLIGSFLSPVYFNLSVGIDYKPTPNLSLYLSPVAGKWTYMMDTAYMDPTRYGIEEGKKLMEDAGARVEFKYKIAPFKFLNINNEFVFFSSYYNPKQNVAIDWKLQIDFKINYYMKTTVYGNLVLDKNYSKKIQLKETLNLGVSFRF